MDGDSASLARTIHKTEAGCLTVEGTPILDVLSHDDELIIVMDYVHGESLHALLRVSCRAKKAIPLPIGCAVLVAVLHGLHAAHEARNEQGEPLGIVHRDVSPQNVLVGADGVARVLDFGIAKAIHAQNQTNPGSLKGKFSYMAPEVVNGSPITRQADVFSAGIVLWEVLTGRMLFKEATERERLMRIVSGRYPSARQLNPAVSPALEWALGRALQLNTKARYSTALEFAIEVERAVSLASQRIVGRVALALRTPVAPPVLGDKGASQSGRAGVRALRDARGCSTQASVGTLAPKDLAASRSARATVSRRPMLPRMWAQERKAVALQSVGIFSDCWASLGRPRRALDRTASGSVATCIRPPFGGSAHPTSVPRQAR